MVKDVAAEMIRAYGTAPGLLMRTDYRVQKLRELRDREEVERPFRYAPVLRVSRGTVTVR